MRDQSTFDPTSRPEPADYERRLPGPYFSFPGSPPVTVRVARRPDGRLVCTGLLVGWEDDTSVTRRAVQRIALGAILRAVEVLQDPAAAELREAAPAAPGPDVATLSRWAASYRAACEDAPRAPIKLLVERSGLSHATVHRIIARCRETGLLPRRYRVGA